MALADLLKSAQSASPTPAGGGAPKSTGGGGLSALLASAAAEKAKNPANIPFDKVTVKPPIPKPGTVERIPLQIQSQTSTPMVAQSNILEELKTAGGAALQFGQNLKEVFSTPEGRENLKTSFVGGGIPSLKNAVHNYNEIFYGGAQKLFSFIGADTLAGFAAQDKEMSRTGAKAASDEVRAFMTTYQDPLDQRTFMDKISQPGGQKEVANLIGMQLPTFLALISTAVLSKGASVPAAPGILATSFALNTGDSYQQGKDYLEEQGIPLDDEWADKLAKISVLVGASTAPLDTIGLERILSSANRVVFKQSVMKYAMQMMLDTGGTVVIEGGTEGLQEIIQNAYAKAYNEHQDLFEGVPEAIVGGGLFGGGGAVTVHSSGLLRVGVDEMLSRGTPEPQIVEAIVEAGKKNGDKVSEEEAQKIIEGVKNPVQPTAGQVTAYDVAERLAQGEPETEVIFSLTDKMTTAEAEQLVAEAKQIEVKAPAPTQTAVIEETTKAMELSDKFDDTILERTPADIQDGLTAAAEAQKKDTQEIKARIEALETKIDEAKPGSEEKKKLKIELTTIKEELAAKVAPHAERSRKSAEAFMDFFGKRFTAAGLGEYDSEVARSYMAQRILRPEYIKKTANTPLAELEKEAIAHAKSENKKRGAPVEFKEGAKVKFNGKEWKIVSILEMAEGDTKYQLARKGATNMWTNYDGLKSSNNEKPPKTQKEQVKEVVGKKGKASIKEIAAETKILEPNVRRILGVGAKDGTFERVGDGVYTIKVGDKDVAYIIPGDALETLPQLAANGFKADMVFLDIPYDAAGNKGGNRMNKAKGTLFETISPEEFEKGIVTPIGTILRTEDAPVVYMYSQSKTSEKTMAPYTQKLIDAGYKPLAKGDYFKMSKGGKRLTMPMRPDALPPEGIIIFNKTGEYDFKQKPDLQFKLVRPKGYQTEKPAELLKALIEMTTEEGDVVLDPFAGSGVTADEAVKAGRTAVAIEKKEGQAAKIAERIEKSLELKKGFTFESNGKKYELTGKTVPENDRVREQFEAQEVGGKEKAWFNENMIRGTKSKRIGLMDYDPSYTPNMRRLIKEAQDNGDTFPFLKMTKEEQAIVDAAFRKGLDAAFTKVGRPENGSEAALEYWTEVIKPQLDKGEAVSIGADDLKDYFGNDYDPSRHKLFSAAANTVFESAVTEAKADTVKWTVGGAASGKTDFAVPHAKEDFAGVIYDSTAWNYEGTKKQIEFAQSKGKKVKIYGLISDLRRSKAYTFQREENGEHPVSDAAFARTHSGAIETMLKLIEDGHDVYVLDTRKIFNDTQADAAEYLHNPVELLTEVKYSEEDVKRFVEGVNKENFREVIAERPEGVEEVPSQNRANQDLDLVTLRTFDAIADRAEAKLVNPKYRLEEGEFENDGGIYKYKAEGGDIPIGQPFFTNDLAELARVTRTDTAATVVTKTGMLTIWRNDPDFRSEPFLTVKEVNGEKLLTFKKKHSNFSLKPSALGLKPDNLKDGDRIRFRPENFKNDAKEIRVVGVGGGVYASAGPAKIGTFEERAKAESGYDNLKLFTAVKELIAKYAKRVGESYLPRHAAGVYYSETENIRVSGMNDLSVAAHEIGHALDFEMHITDRLMKVVKESVVGNPVYDSKTLKERKALTEVYEKYYPGGRSDHPLKKRLIEGFATFLQKYMEMPKSIENAYPELVSSFLKPGGQFYEKRVADMLEDARKIVDIYQGLTPLDKIGARVTSDLQEVEKDTFLNAGDRIRTEIFDNIYPLEKLGKKAGTANTTADPSLWARLYNNSASLVLNNLNTNRGYWTFKNGEFVKIHDFNWKTLVKKLETEKQTDSFAFYLVARDQYFEWQVVGKLHKKYETLNALANEQSKLSDEDREALMEEGTLVSKKMVDDAYTAWVDAKKVLDKNGFTAKEVTDAYMQNKDRFTEEEEMFDALTRGDLDFLHDEAVQLVDHDLYRQLSTKEGYASLKRDFYDELVGEDSENLAKGVRVGGTRVSSMIGRKGSSRAIINPVYSAVRNHAEVTKKALKQIVYNRIGDIGISAQFPDLFQKLQLQAVPQGNGRMLFPQDKDPNIIMARRDYKRTPILTDSVIKRTVDEVLNYQNIGYFEQAFMSASRFFTKGTTGLFPGFAVTNAMIDQITATAQTKTNYVPVYSALKMLFARLSTGKQGETAQYFTEYLVMGGERQTFVGWQDLTPNELLKAVRDEATGLNKALDLLNKGTDVLAIPAKYSEIATRATEYVRARQKGMPAIAALEQAGRVTAPFHHIGRLGGGRGGQSFIKSIPFFNPILQVLDQSARAAFNKETGTRYGFVALALTASLVSSLGILMATASDEQKDLYLDIQPGDLLKYIFIPNPNGRTLIRIRVPDQMAVFGALINMAIADHALDAKYTVGDYIDTATAWLPQQFDVQDPARAFVAWVPQLFKPGVLVAFNKKDYPEIMDLESESQRRKPAGLRFTEGTTPVAKFIGEKLNISPIKIDYLLSGYFGRAIGFVMAKPGIYNPFSTINQKYYFSSGRRVQDYYDLKEQNEQDITAARQGLKTFTDEEKQAIAERKQYLTAVDKLLDVYRDIDIEAEPEKAAEYRTRILEYLDRVNEI